MIMGAINEVEIASQNDRENETIRAIFSDLSINLFISTYKKTPMVVELKLFGSNLDMKIPKEWEVRMVFREIFSNVRDENFINTSSCTKTNFDIVFKGYLVFSTLTIKRL